ncbi:MAG: tetratricopeptide repeat protein [Kastovskya adunca ATA6-11-RM4]|jgi:tetratricopeptide (TPR) repeat protein|nr:tetratricopeptide repeat protein [Kastovskya adunca ATA6-11-RM4]
MDADQAIGFTNSLLVDRGLKNLDNIESTLFREVWKGRQGKTYQQIADSEAYGLGTIKDDASELWQRLTTLFEERVTRNTLRAVVERYSCRVSKAALPSGQILKTDVSRRSSSESEGRNPGFVGRESDIAHLNTLVSQGTKVILICAKGGVGKTTLARIYLQQQFCSYIEFPIAKETQNITSVESLVEERLKQLGEEPGREFGVSLDRLKRKLQTERIGVLIDNLEPALDKNGKFIEPHRGYVELLRVLSDPTVQSVTLVTSRECLRESAVTVRHYPLEGLDVAAWQAFFYSRNIQTSSPSLKRDAGEILPTGEVDSPALHEMHKAYGGNAKAMDILSSAILQDYEGDLEAYWQVNQGDLLIERDLEDLVATQFSRLQQLDSDSYKLLCRMGCYRYQDVPTVPEGGLFCLLWDVPEAKHRRVIKSLKDRSLVEFGNGEYWLHPVIRAEAISRLRASEDWETANRKAAEFWTESVKVVEVVEDAMRALEAYYHYIEINAYKQACNVIIKKRKTPEKKNEFLGNSFYRLGLLQLMIFVIDKIIIFSSGHEFSRVYNILGDLYWLTGCLHKAIKYHEKSREMAIESKDKELEIISFFNIGLCQIDLGEIQEAINLFEKVTFLAETNECHRCAVSAWYCLAFLNSQLGHEQKALRLANKVEQELSLITRQWSAWSSGYSLLFLGATYKNLKNKEKSYNLYCQAISFSERANYPQVKAKALIGLAELYREENFETALSHHSEAIKLLDKIGAKCDIAEAYYQLGLTYQKIGEDHKSQENFKKAIRLFSEMEAPKQVEKVQQAMKAGD